MATPVYNVDSKRAKGDARTCANADCNTKSTIYLFCNKANCRRKYTIVKNNPDKFHDIIQFAFNNEYVSTWDAVRAAAQKTFATIETLNAAACLASVAISESRSLKRTADYLEAASNVMKASTSQTCNLLFPSWPRKHTTDASLASLGKSASLEQFNHVVGDYDERLAPLGAFICIFWLFYMYFGVF